MAEGNHASKHKGIKSGLRFETVNYIHLYFAKRQQRKQ